MSNFPFIDDKVMRENMDIVFDHIIELLTISDSVSYKNKPTIVSSFRKTIIIYTSSIIEALLLWKLKKEVKEKEVELSDEWKYFDIKILHIIPESNNEIIACKRSREKKILDRLDFVRVINLCLKFRIINDKLSDGLNKTRELRNRLHIGGLKKVEQTYTRNDLDFVFQLAKNIKNVVSNNS